MMNTPVMSKFPTPHISFTAYPLGAWLVALVGAAVFFLLSHHPEKVSIAQIIVAGSMAVATVGGVVYALLLLAFKRYPSFARSFGMGFVLALLCTAVGVVLTFWMNEPRQAFLSIAVFMLLSAAAPLLVRKNA